MNRKAMVALSVLACAAIGAHRPAAQAKSGQNSERIRQALIGVWQTSASMSADWSEAYQFDRKGTFAWHASQADCEAREVSHSGTWKFQGGKLILKTTLRKSIEGGKLVPATGSCGSKFEIQGGKMRVQNVRPPKTQSLAVEDLSFDKGSGHLAAFLGRKRLWKFSDNPKFYDQN